MSERPKEPASKAGEVKASEGSNPSVTAMWPSRSLDQRQRTPDTLCCVRKVSATLFAVSAACVIAMAVMMIVDWQTYITHPGNSMPYYGYVLGLAIVFLVPAAVFLVIGLVINKRSAVAA